MLNCERFNILNNYVKELPKSRERERKRETSYSRYCIGETMTETLNRETRNKQTAHSAIYFIGEVPTFILYFNNQGLNSMAWNFTN